jgi:hypothetical protein
MFMYVHVDAHADVYVHENVHELLHVHFRFNILLPLY